MNSRLTKAQKFGFRISENAFENLYILKPLIKLKRKNTNKTQHDKLCVRIYLKKNPSKIDDFTVNVFIYFFKFCRIKFYDVISGAN